MRTPLGDSLKPLMYIHLGVVDQNTTNWRLLVAQGARWCSERGYRGTSPLRKRTLLGPYRRPMPRVLGGRRFLMGGVPLACCI